MENRSSGSPSFTQGLNVGGADVTSGRVLSEYYTGATKPSSPANGAFWWNGTDLHQYINGKFRILDGSFTPVNYGSRGVFAGGYDSGGTSNVIDYITIASTGNATDFGNLTVARNQAPASMSNITRGVFAGGSAFGGVNTIDYITVASTGNATDFGDLTVGRQQSAGASNGTTGLIIAGNSSAVQARTDAEKLTIATTGNATLYSGTTGSAQSCTGWSNGDRAVFAIGYNGSAKSNTMEFLSFATEGNSTDFGDLTVVRNNHSATGNRTRMLVVGGDT